MRITKIILSLTIFSAAITGVARAGLNIVVQPEIPVVTEDSNSSLIHLEVAFDESGANVSGGARIRLASSMGKVDDLGEIRPGVRRFGLDLSGLERPEFVSVLAIAFDRGIVDAGGIVVPVGFQVGMPGRSEPGARIAAEAGGRRVGLAEAGKNGRFELSFPMFPGQRRFSIVAEDENGNITRQVVDMGLEWSGRLTGIVHPNNLIADGKTQAEIALMLQDSKGEIIKDPDGLKSVVEHGYLEGPLVSGGPTFRYVYTSPKEAPEQPDRVSISWGSTAFQTSVFLTGGQPGSALLSSDSGAVEFGGKSALRLEVKDVRGRPLNSALVEFEASIGEVSTVENLGDGAFSAVFTPSPDSIGAAAAVQARVTPVSTSQGAGTSITSNSVSIRILAGPPVAARLEADPEALSSDGVSASQLTLTLEDAGGNPAPGYNPTVSADIGTVGQPTDGGDGTYRFTYTAPKGQEGKTATIQASTASVSAQTTIQLSSERATSLEASAEPLEVEAGSSQAVVVSATLRDEAGRGVTGKQPKLAVTAGAAGALNEKGGGAYSWSWTPPPAPFSGDVRLTVSFEALTEELTVAVARREAAVIELSSTQDSIVADGASTMQLVAAVKDASGAPVVEETVEFSATDGEISGVSNQGDGTWTATYKAPKGVGSGAATILAKGSTSASKPASDPLTVALIAGDPATLDFKVSKQEVKAGEGTEIVLTATVSDSAGNPVPDAEAVWEVSEGSGSVSGPERTSEQGTAAGTYLAGETAGKTVVTATVGGLTQSKEIQVLAGAPTEIELIAAPDALPADGVSVSKIEARVRDAYGNPLANRRVDFLVAAGDGLLNVSFKNTDAEGIAIVTFTASLSSGVETLRAFPREDDTLAAEATITETPAVPAVVQVSVDPETIPADGASQAAATAVVLDAGGEPVPNVPVYFTLPTGGGAIEAGGLTDENGEASAAYTSSTFAGSYQIKAEAGKPARASGLASIAQQAGSPATLDVALARISMTADGVSSSRVTVDVEDLFGNPVPDGTPVTMSVTAGTLVAIVGSAREKSVSTLNDLKTVGGRVQADLIAPTAATSATLHIEADGRSFDQAVTFTPGPVASYSVTVPSSAVAGSAFSMTVAPFDVFGNATTAGTVVCEARDAAGASVPGGLDVTGFNLSGGALTTSSQKTTKAGTLSIVCTAGAAVVGGGAKTVSVSAAAPAALTVTSGDGQSAEQGTALPQAILLSLQDGFDNPVSGTVVDFAVLSGGGVLSSASAATNDSGTVTAPQWTLGQTFTGNTQQVGASVSGTSLNATVSAQAQYTPRLAGFDVSDLPATILAGQDVSFLVTALDDAGSPFTGYAGTIVVGVDDGTASTPAPQTFGAGDLGVKTASGLIFGSPGSFVITVADSADGSKTGAANAEVHAPFDRFEFSGIPDPIDRNASTGFTLKAIGSDGAVMTVYTGTASFSSSDSAATLPAAYAFQSADAGVKTFDGGVGERIVFGTAGGQTVTATDADLNRSGSSPSITVRPELDHFEVSGVTDPITVGQSSGFTVAAKDADGATLTWYEGTVTFSSSDPGATLPSAYAFQPSDNGARTFSGAAGEAAVFLTAGEQTLTAVEQGGVLFGVQLNITVNPPFDRFAVTNLTSPINQNQQTGVRVEVQDSSGLVAGGYTGTVRFTSTDPQAVLPSDYAFQPEDGGVKVFDGATPGQIVSFLTSGNQTVTVTDTVDPSLTGTSGNVAVTQTLGSFQIAHDGAATAGQPETFALSAKDASGAAFPGYSGTAALSHNGTGAVSWAVVSGNGALTDNGDGTASYAFAPADNGQVQLSATDLKAETIKIAAADGAVQSAGANLTVSPGPLDHFDLSLAGPQTVGVAFAGTNTLTAKDAGNNTITTFNAGADNVTLSSSLVGTISGLGAGVNNVLNQSGNFVSGVANLTALGMKFTGTSGVGTFTATSSGSKTGTSGAVALNVGALDHFTVTIATPETPGVAFSGINRIVAEDIGGNAVTTFDASVDNVTVTTTLVGTISGLGSGANHVLNQAADFVSGVADLTALGITYSGPDGVGTFTATSSSGKTGVSGSVTISSTALHHFDLTIAAPQTVGVPFAGANLLAAKDASNNTITTFDASVDNVTLSSSLAGIVSGLGTGADAVLNQAGNFVNGVADLTAMGMKFTGTSGAGTFTATSSGGKTGTSGAVTLNVGALDHFALSLSTPQTVGSAFAGANTLTAQDAGNNTVTTFDASADNVTMTTTLAGTISGLGTGANAVLNQAGDFVNGVADLSSLGLGMKFTGTSGAGTFTATSSGGKTGTSGAVTVNVGPLDHFALSLSTPQTVGAAFTGTNTLTAKDAGNNTIITFDASADNVTMTTTLAGTISGLGTGANAVLDQAGDFVNGVADLTALGMKFTGTSGAGTFTATSSGGKTGTSGAVTVNVGALDHFALSLSTPQTVGSAFAGANTLTAQDAGNNTITTFDASADNVTMTTTLAGTISGLGTGANAVLNQAGDFVNGVADLTALGMKFTGTAGAGTFTTTSAGGKTGTSGAVTVSVGPLDHFALSLSTPQTVGSAFAGANTLTAQDAGNNTITTFDASADNVTMTATLAGTISGLGSGANNALNQAGDFVGGVADLTALGMKFSGTSGSGTFTATSAGGKTGTSGSITLNPGALDHFDVVIASPQSSGVIFSGVNTIAAKDAGNNTITTFDASASNVTLTSTIVGTIKGLGTGNNHILNQAGDFVSGVADLTALGMYVTGANGAGTFTATSSSKTGTSGAVTVSPSAVIDHFVLAHDGAGEVGLAETVTLTAIASTGGTFAEYDGTVTLSTNGTAASINWANVNGAGVFNSNGAGLGTAVYSFVTADAGSAQFTLTDNAAETLNITVTDGTHTDDNTEGNLVVAPASVDHFDITGLPASVNDGQKLGFTVTARTASNGVAAQYTGTVAFASTNSGSDTLPADYAFTALDAGVKTFAGTGLEFVQFNTAGAGQTFTVQDSVLTAASGSVTVTVVAPGTLSSFEIVNFPSVVAPSADVENFMVIARDAGGQTVTGHTGTVTFSTTAGGSPTVPGNYTFVASDYGVKSFSGVGNRFNFPAMGSFTVTVKDSVTPSISGTVNVRAATAGVLDYYDVEEPSSAIPGVNFAVRIVPRDAFGTATTGSAAVTLSAQSADGVAGIGTLGVTSANTSAGTATIASQTYSATETIKIRATDGSVSDAGFGAISPAIVVKACALGAGVPAGSFLLTPASASITANGASTVVFTSSTVRDCDGNAAPDNTCMTVMAERGTITTADNTGACPGNAGIQIVTSGGVFSFTLQSTTVTGIANAVAMSVAGTAKGQGSVEFSNAASSPTAVNWSPTGTPDRTLVAYVQFDRPMDPSTINESSLKMVQKTTGAANCTGAPASCAPGGNWTAVGGSVTYSYDEDSKIAGFTPDAAFLTPNRCVQVCVLTTALDLDGNAATAHAWTFTPGAGLDTTVPTAAGPTDAPDPISPDGDGTDDTTTFSATLNDGVGLVKWEVWIKDGGAIAAKAVKFQTANGADTVTWDGKDENGDTLDNKTYSYEATAYDQSGNQATPVAGDGITVDSALSFGNFGP